MEGLERRRFGHPQGEGLDIHKEKVWTSTEKEGLDIHKEGLEEGLDIHKEGLDIHRRRFGHPQAWKWEGLDIHKKRRFVPAPHWVRVEGPQFCTGTSVDMNLVNS